VAELKPLVVILDHTAKLSGGEIQLLHLLPTLERHYRFHVLVGEDGPLVTELLHRGISVEVLPIGGVGAMRRADVKVSTSVMSLIALARYIAAVRLRLLQLRPVLVHCNSLKADIYGSIAARASGVPVLWHLHDRLAADYLPRAPLWLMRAATAVLPDFVIANSETTRSTITWSRAQIRVLPYAINPAFYLDAPRRTGLPKGGRISFGIVGRIAPWKGQDHVVRAFAQVGEGHELHIIGAPLFGEEAYGASVRALARELGVEDRVKFLGFLTDVPAALADLDVLVHASVIPEPFGQVIVEGMAMGLPVLAADKGGPAEIINSGFDGVLYPAGDIRELARLMRLMAETPSLRSRLGAHSRARALEFAPERVGSRYRSVYEEASKRAMKASALTSA
jgi:glycosyltransferase involved in cell wall biosynthesis